MAEILEEELRAAASPSSSSSSSVVKDLFAGAVGGVAQVLIGGFGFFLFLFFRPSLSLNEGVASCNVGGVEGVVEVHGRKG
jgi:hypothetical protein